jgi:uncharacterized heparinase superfamily protein
VVAASGNTLSPPPRLSGDQQADNQAMQQWVQSLYVALALNANVVGTQEDHEARIAKLEAALAQIAALTAAASPASATYAQADATVLADNINAIITAAGSVTA